LSLEEVVDDETFFATDAGILDIVAEEDKDNIDAVVDDADKVVELIFEAADDENFAISFTGKLSSDPNPSSSISSKASISS
jgi:hypothetical protein